MVIFGGSLSNVLKITVTHVDEASPRVVGGRSTWSRNAVYEAGGPGSTPGVRIQLHSLKLLTQTDTASMVVADFEAPRFLSAERSKYSRHMGSGTGPVPEQLRFPGNDIEPKAFSVGAWEMILSDEPSKANYPLWTSKDFQL
ncbi:hypothetical protein DFH06DRAFT_1136263 [Mycena polygramma]|nr:hypothetical protein DFH06DRAFT_1136263 [Mycena polygramma]